MNSPAGVLKAEESVSKLPGPAVQGNRVPRGLPRRTVSAATPPSQVARPLHPFSEEDSELPTVWRTIMAGQKEQGPQRPMKGFRPGKAPPELRKRQAKQQFRDLTPTQERLVETFAERTPEEARALIRRWTTGLLIAALVLTALAVALFFWSTIAGVIVAILAVVVWFVWDRMRRQRAAFEQMADAVTRAGGKKRRGR